MEIKVYSFRIFGKVYSWHASDEVFYSEDSDEDYYMGVPSNAELLSFE